MCIHRTRVLYSVVITRQSNQPISQFNSLCNEFTIVNGQCLYTIYWAERGVAITVTVPSNRFKPHYFAVTCLYSLEILTWEWGIFLLLLKVFNIKY